MLRQLTEAVSSRARVPIRLDVEGHYSLPPEIQIAFYRIAQEALNNVAKHAQAGQATVRISYQPERIELFIGDNGRGFILKGIMPDHLGLNIMRERAEAIAAKLNIESQVGQGTSVSVIWENKEAKDNN